MPEKRAASDHEVGIPGRPHLHDDRGQTISAERVAEIRLRIRTGVYASPHIIDAVARGLSNSVDL